MLKNNLCHSSSSASDVYQSASCFKAPSNRGSAANKQQFFLRTGTQYSFTCRCKDPFYRSVVPRHFIEVHPCKMFVLQQGWSSPHTLILFYSVDVNSTLGSQVLSSLPIFSTQVQVLCNAQLAEQTSFQYGGMGINNPIVLTPWCSIYVLEREDLRVLYITLFPEREWWCQLQTPFYGLGDALRFVTWPAFCQ